MIDRINEESRLKRKPFKELEKRLSERIEKLEKKLREEYINGDIMILEPLNKEINELKQKITDIKLSNSAKMINQNKIIADYTLLKERIEKLEDSLQKCGVKWEFILDEHRGEINELKEHIRQTESLQTIVQHSKDHETIGRILREFLLEKPLTQYTRNKLLKMLDEGNGEAHHKCTYVDCPLCYPKEPLEERIK